MTNLYFITNGLTAGGVYNVSRLVNMYAYGSCSAVLTSNMICNMAPDCQMKFQSFTWFDKNMTLKVNMSLLKIQTF